MSDDLALAAYRLLLRAYPAAFRAAFERDMVQLFRDQRRELWGDQRRDARADAPSHLGFWAAVVWDVARSAPALRLDALSARWRAGWRALRHGPPNDGPHTHLPGGTMRTTIGVLTMLSGAYEIVNALFDVKGHGAAPADAGWVAAVALSILMGLLLLASGGALLRGGRTGAHVARVAAFATLALVVGLQLTFPFMSIFSRLLGFAVPIVLLVVTRSRGPSVPAVA